MKKLSSTTYERINNFINTNARPLERALFNYYFGEEGGDRIVKELEIYQNSDGGFGGGIEPDFKLKDSSPLATSIGLRYLSRLEYYDRAQAMIKKAVTYLEESFDVLREGWFSVPKEVNDYPHAPWWDFKEDINMTVIDYSWGNPTAELIGYLYRYRNYLCKLDIHSLVSYAVKKLNEQKDFKSEHEIYCYIRMYHSLDCKDKREMEDKLRLAVAHLMNVNPDEWTNYVPSPLKFIEFNSKDHFGIEKRFIDQNLDYIIDQLEEHGRILPTWVWDRYPVEWEAAKIQWEGVLTLEAVLSLHSFSRISENVTMK